MYFLFFRDLPRIKRETVENLYKFIHLEQIIGCEDIGNFGDGIGFFLRCVQFQNVVGVHANKIG